jgi:hypothetical protein
VDAHPEDTLPSGNNIEHLRKIPETLELGNLFSLTDSYCRLSLVSTVVSNTALQVTSNTVHPEGPKKRLLSLQHPTTSNDEVPVTTTTSDTAYNIVDTHCSDYHALVCGRPRDRSMAQVQQLHMSPCNVTATHTGQNMR